MERRFLNIFFVLIRDFFSFCHIELSSGSLLFLWCENLYPFMKSAALVNSSITTRKISGKQNYNTYLFFDKTENVFLNKFLRSKVCSE